MLGRQFTQLQMFMKPSELQAMPNFDYLDRFEEGGEGVAQLRSYKLGEADATGLSRKIEEQGVKKPVSVAHYAHAPVLKDGHHRFFVAERMERRGKETYLPVKHLDWT